MFQRGEGPLVSVIFPTRGRPERLLEAVKSVWETATIANQVEVCLWVDSDDTVTQEAVKWVASLGPENSLKAIVGPRLKGYYNLHTYYNELARISTGDWCLLFNDDAKIITKGWDEMLDNTNVSMPNRNVNDIFGFQTYNPSRPRTSEFFFFRRKIYDILGYLSPLPAVDTHLSNILIAIGAFWELPIAIEHNNDSNKDVTFEEGKEARQWGCYVNVDTQAIRQRIADMNKLMDYTERTHKVTV